MAGLELSAREGGQRAEGRGRGRRGEGLGVWGEEAVLELNQEGNP